MVCASCCHMALVFVHLYVLYEHICRHSARVPNHACMWEFKLDVCVCVWGGGGWVFLSHFVVVVSSFPSCINLQTMFTDEVDSACSKL